MRLYGTAILALAILGQASASLTFVNNSGALGATDFIDWATIGGDQAGTAATFNGLTNLGMAYQVNAATTGSLYTQDYSWNGSFDVSGERVLMPNYQTSGSMSITFAGSQQAFGTQIQSNLYGDFDATISVYNNFNLLLGSTTVHGVSGYHNGGDPYIGIIASNSDIAKVVISSTNDAYGFAIGRVDAGQCGAVPEPASMAVLGLGVVGMIRRRRKA